MTEGKDIIPAPQTDGIDPNAPEVKFVSLECRTCGERGPWANAEDRSDPNHGWDPRHAEETGHRRYYMWSITRNTAEVWAPPNARKRK